MQAGLLVLPGHLIATQFTRGPNIGSVRPAKRSACTRTGNMCRPYEVGDEYERGTINTSFIDLRTIAVHPRT